MLSYKESLKILEETNALLEGHFILSSGLHSKQYIQCAKLLSHPKKAESICGSLCEKIKEMGSKIIREPGPMKHGSTIIAFVEDPDKYKIELIQKKN